jgi:cobalamin synthase
MESFIKCALLSLVISLSVWSVNELTFKVSVFYLVLIIVLLCVMANMYVICSVKEQTKETTESLILENRPMVSQREEVMTRRDILSNRPKNDIKA